MRIFVWFSAFTSVAAFSLAPRRLLSPPTTSLQAQTVADATESSTPVKDTTTNSDNTDQSPGMRENAVFECDESVYFWRDFQRQGLATTAANVQHLAEITQRFTTRYGPAGLDHWWRYVGRSAYFVTNAALGVVANNLHDRLVNRNNGSDGNPFVSGIQSAASRLVLEAALVCEEDFLAIQKGLYRKPYDMFEASRQRSPLYYAPQTVRFVREAVGALTRRKRQAEEDKQIWLGASTELYPDYYLNNFHYQTDGWFSAESAATYEVSTETLFLGRQDAMQRTALPVLLEHSKRIRGRPMRVLEIACGTGRFMTFCRDNLPRDAEYTAIDLSPFYLEKARENDNEWRRLRRDSNIAPAQLIQTKAENLPFQAEKFDAVLCVYLFHELPREIRSQVVQEMSRVVKPGGVVILTDSLQKGDRPVLDKNIGNFQNMNEPFYTDYIEDYLPDHFARAGLKPISKTVRSVTKTLAFKKPNDLKEN